MQRRHFCKPYMPVDAGSFIEPAFFHGRVNAHGNNIVAAVIKVIGNVVTEADVAAVFGAKIKTIDPNNRIAEHTVKFNKDAFTKVGFRD